MIKEIIEYLKEEQKNNKTEYDRLLLVEEAYNNENMEEVVNYFFERFGQNFRAILEFCMQNSIIPDFSSEKEEKFIDAFSKLLWKSMPYRDNEEVKDIYGRVVANRKISSLNKMILVRRCDLLPEDDKLEPVLTNATYKSKDKIFLDGKKQEYEYEASLGHCTIHFTMNQEVKPHADAPEGWIDKKYTILQPMTEELYKTAISFEPMDTYFFGNVKLDNYIVICDSLESAKELITKNKSAIPIIAGKGKVPGFGNKIVGCMGIACPYIDYHGKWHSHTIPIENYYTDDFLKSHPDITKCGHAVGDPIHDLADEIRYISIEIEVSGKVLELIGTNYSFEETIKLLMDNTKFIFPIVYLSRAREKLKNDELLTSTLPHRYREFGSFLDYMMCNANINIEEIDIQTLFEKMCEGLTIDETNINQFKKIKESVINLVTDYNKTHRQTIDKNFDKENDKEKLGELLSKLLALYKMMKTDAMKLPVREPEMYDVPIEWYELGGIEAQKKKQLDESLQSGKSFYDAIGELFQNSEFVKPDFPLQRPKSTIIFRANTLCQANMESTPTIWEFQRGLKEWITPFANGQHVSKNDIERINQIVNFVTVLENDRVLELEQENSKSR